MKTWLVVVSVVAVLLAASTGVGFWMVSDTNAELTSTLAELTSTQAELEDTKAELAECKKDGGLPPPTYTLSVSVSPPGAGAVSPSGGQYESGEQVTLTASPAAGYTFDYWSGIASGTTPTITITVDSDKSLTANFKAVTQTYALTTSVSPSGAGSVSPAGGEYESGVQVTLTASPAAGYTFGYWSGSASGTTSTITVTMDSDKSLTANFETIPESEIIPTHTLTTDISPSGAGSVSPSSGDFEQGTQINMVATPTAGYRFSHWSGDGSGTNPTIMLTMDRDKNVVANFVHEHVWITPVEATASGYTIWGGTWYTGPPSLAIDGNEITAWTLNDMGEITFDLGSEKLIGGIEAYWGGHVTNGNTVNVYIDEQKVLSNEQFGATSNIRYFTPIRGRFVKYQTVALPHNEYLQIATWSEIAEFKVKIVMEE